MRSLHDAAALVALAALSWTVTAQDALSVDMVTAMGNNSLFTRWRPISHFIAPAGWMNDPCGTMYNPHTGNYHVLYQWHPQHINWGNISWGNAISKDLITWTDITGWEDDEALGISPEAVGTYDGLGIFSGTAQPVNLQGESNGTLSVFYTSVSKLPISWSIPYMKGAETQSIATSDDDGKTWQRYEGNPVISTPPEGWNITGFRDPFVEPFPDLDMALGQNEPHYYAVFGSGIKGVGPRMPLYSAPASDLTNWTFQGALWEPSQNTSFGSVIETGTYAFNFEVSGFFSLPDSQGRPHFYVNMGTEGGNVSFHQAAHWALWNEGTISRRDNGSAEFTPVAGGVADAGNLYALTSFIDVKNDNRRVLWGWSPEDLLGNFALTQQGFQGCFALPRHLFVHETPNIIDTDGSLSQPGSACLQTNENNATMTAYTLGVRPLPEVVTALRSKSQHQSISTEWQEYDSCNPYGTPSEGSSHMEIQITISNATGPAGVYLARSPNGEESTTVFYSPENNTIIVDRSSSTLLAANVTTEAVQGYFKPYTTRTSSITSFSAPACGPSGGNNGTQKEESITLQIFLDGSLLEVYANDRFALTTRIYPAMQTSTGFGTWVGEGASANFEGFQSWTGLMDVWPGRPRNSSSQLVWDPPSETNNTQWWVGN